MLTWDFVLKRIKDELALPFQELEKTDEEIIEYCQDNALRKFSWYFPETKRLPIDTRDVNIQVEGISNEYYIIDDDDRDIYGVTEFIPEDGENFFLGAPILPPFGFNEVPNWALKDFEFGNTKPFSWYSYTHEFHPPNRFRITPSYLGNAVVEYERLHAPDLSSISAEFHDLFVDLCYGMFAMMIGRIRKKYNPIATPFGEIQINADEIYTDGQEVYNRTIEKLDGGARPNIVMDVG